MLVLKMRRKTFEMRKDLNFNLFDVISMNAIEPFFRTVSDFILLISEHQFPSR